jgi:hypothetical protein
MARVMERDDLINAVQKLRSAKEEVVKVAMVLGMDKKFKETTKELKSQIDVMCISIDLIDNKIIELDFPSKFM